MCQHFKYRIRRFIHSETISVFSHLHNIPTLSVSLRKMFILSLISPYDCWQVTNSTPALSCPILALFSSYLKLLYFTTITTQDGLNKLPGYLLYRVSCFLLSHIEVKIESMYWSEGQTFSKVVPWCASLIIFSTKIAIWKKNLKR
jgi:hypothetical protein